MISSPFFAHQIYGLLCVYVYVSVSYLEPREISLASRQSRLKEQFGFDCNCRLCFESNTITVTTSWMLEAYVELPANAFDSDHMHQIDKVIGDVRKEEEKGVPDADMKRRREGGREHEGEMAGGVTMLEDDLDTKGKRCVEDFLFRGNMRPVCL